MGLGGTDTIHIKEKLELETEGMGVTIHSSHADNRSYKSKEFQKDIDKMHKMLTVSRVGAHDQNRVTGRAIQTVVNPASAMMPHQVIMCY